MMAISEPGSTANAVQVTSVIHDHARTNEVNMMRWQPTMPHRQHHPSPPLPTNSLTEAGGGSMLLKAFHAQNHQQSDHANQEYTLKNPQAHFFVVRSSPAVQRGGSGQTYEHHMTGASASGALNQMEESIFGADACGNTVTSSNVHDQRWQSGDSHHMRSWNRDHPPLIPPNMLDHQPLTNPSQNTHPPSIPINSLTPHVPLTSSTSDYQLDFQKWKQQLTIPHNLTDAEAALALSLVQQQFSTASHPINHYQHQDQPMESQMERAHRLLSTVPDLSAAPVSEPLNDCNDNNDSGRIAAFCNTSTKDESTTAPTSRRKRNAVANGDTNDSNGSTSGESASASPKAGCEVNETVKNTSKKKKCRSNSSESSDVTDTPTERQSSFRAVKHISLFSSNRSMQKTSSPTPTPPQSVQPASPLAPPAALNPVPRPSTSSPTGTNGINASEGKPKPKRARADRVDKTDHRRCSDVSSDLSSTPPMSSSSSASESEPAPSPSATNTNGRKRKQRTGGKTNAKTKTDSSSSNPNGRSTKQAKPSRSIFKGHTDDDMSEDSEFDAEQLDLEDSDDEYAGVGASSNTGRRRTRSKSNMSSTSRKDSINSESDVTPGTAAPTKHAKQELRRIRNREAAQRSRERKLMYTKNLENENEVLMMENARLKRQLVKLKASIKASYGKTE
ncbi:hypothetical protein SeLEV6574_g02367 [Synchytrium endobioticum]|uniref:BZIP domain-containing protein n=1 Tax=Synchytrium endobioticum TaxID=286115 RepID=A0A507D952_9FUNG|nr:hypothetical protein SeLEV6574_g02367 [Synchytrium endobioticum]